MSSVTCLSKRGNGATSAPIKGDAALLGRKAPLLPSIHSLRIHMHHTHKPGLFSSYPHTIPAPTQLMFIHQPLGKQTQKPVKTKSHLVINGARPYAHEVERSKPRGIMGFLESFTPFRWILLEVPSNLGQTQNCTGAVLVGVWGRPRRARGGKTSGGKGPWKGGGIDRPRFHGWWLTACHPGSVMISDWQVEGEERVGKEGGLEWELHKTSSSLGDCSDHSLMIKKRGSVFSLHTTPCCFFVRWD